jgi:hypothetical protein
MRNVHIRGEAMSVRPNVSSWKVPKGTQSFKALGPKLEIVGLITIVTLDYVQAELSQIFQNGSSYKN